MPAHVLPGVGGDAVGPGAGAAAGAGLAAGADAAASPLLPAGVASFCDAAAPSPVSFCPSTFASDGFFAVPLSRKSVTYQPLPFNWKPAAVTFFTSRGWWHAGHSKSGGSEIFCNASCPAPPAAHC